MAGVPNASAFGTGIQPAASASSCSQAQMPMQPSGQMIGPSTNCQFIRQMPYQMIPQGYNTQPTEGNYGYGYYNSANPNCYIGTGGVFHNPVTTVGNYSGASHARANAGCGVECFSAVATSPVNACGFDAGGVPITIAALQKYNSAAMDAQNSWCNWNNAIHASNGQCQAVAISQWLGLEGGTRGLCLLAGLLHEVPGGLCVGENSGGGCNMPGYGPLNYPSGCIVTFAHEMQEMLNPCCSGPEGQDTSDVRYNTPGTCAHCNNFKSCGVGYQCFDTAFTAYWGTDYGNSPNAWQYAKTPSYAGGQLLAPGGGGPLPGQPGGPGGPTVGPPCIHVLPGCVTVHPYVIPQAKPAHSCTQKGPGRKRLQEPICTPVSPYPLAHGGFTCLNPYVQMAAGGKMIDPVSAKKRIDCSAHAKAATPPPTTPGPKICVPSPPICITIPPPTGPAPQPEPNLVPFVSVSPAYPYRGTVCANQITYPGGETWNFPLGSPEVPGGPGIPTPPGCAPPPAPTPKPNPGTGNPVIPITNNPGICGIQCVNGTWVLIGPCGPINSPICTGNPNNPPPPSPHPQPGCGPCNPCQPCNPCGPQPCGPSPTPSPCPTPAPSPFGTRSPFMPCYMGISPWPSPQNVFGGALPTTPWLPGGKVDNGLGPSPAMPASPVYGPAPADNAAYQGPQIPAPTMPFASPSSTTTTTTTGICANGFPTIGQWDRREDQQMLNHNYSQGGNCVWGLAANLQAGNIAFPSVTHVCTQTSPGLAPVTPGQCGNMAAYPGSDKWVGTNPNPYIHGCAPAPCGPSPCGPGGGDGDCDWDDQGGHNQALGQQHMQWGGHHGPGGGHPGGVCYFQQNGSFTGPACFGGNQWANQGVWGGWGNPYGPTGETVEDPAEAFINSHWCQWLAADIAKQQGLHPGTTCTHTTTGAIPCWHPPDWNAGNNPAFTNTSSPVGQGQFPTWPGGVTPGGGTITTGGDAAQQTPFQNGDLYEPGFETVGACFVGNPWQPSQLSLDNPGAIDMGLAGFQIPAPAPAPAPAPSPSPSPGGGGWGHHAHGGPVGKLVDVELSPGENVIMPCGEKQRVPGQAEYSGDTVKNDTYRTKLPPGAIVVPRTVSGKADKERRFVAAIRAQKSPAEALRRAHG